MDRKLMYWLTGGLAAVLVILLVYNFTNRNTGNDIPAPTTENHSAHSSTAAGTGATSASSGAATDNLTSYIAEQDQIMMDMMDEMRLDTPSGNASVDFLRGMIPHHESAIAMADSLLKYGGENEEIKKLAEDIISVQKEEIEDMQQMITELSDESMKDEEKEAAYLNEYNKMFDNPHSHHIDTSGVKSVDEAFAMGMITHHQMAVDMARSIFEYTDSDKLKEMAKNIIEVQEKEIAQMQELIKEMQAE